MPRQPVSDLEIVEPPAFSVVEFRREQAEQVITSHVPRRFEDATADNAEIAEWVEKFLADPKSCPTLLVVGPTGTGKTWQLWGALKAILRGLAEQGQGLDFRATSHPDLNDAMRPKPDQSHAFAIEPFLKAQLVLIDDLGTGKQTEWTGDGLYRLVDYRWSRQLPSMFTTNLTAARFTESVGDRVASRLADGVRVAMKGEDRRWKP
jgi:DNA replication protein DnaC